MKNTPKLMKSTTLSLLFTLAISPAILAADMKNEKPQDMAMDARHADQSFTKKTYKIRGQYAVITQNGQTVIRLSDDFKTKAGPDLKIFLSPLSVDAVTGDSATQGSISLGGLKSNKGSSDYIVPAHIDLSLYASVLIHCEAYSVLWGAAAL